MLNPFKKKTFKTFIWITLLGFAISGAICPERYLSTDNFFRNWPSIVLSILYTYVLGYGCTFISLKIENKFSWLEQPREKFFFHFVTLAVYSFIVSALLFYVFAYLVFDDNKWLTWSEVLHQAKLPALISVFISAFFTGVEFLKNWRVEAVRAERLEKEKIATQYESLKNQVNPHFLFNSLNALSELVYENQELAVNYIRQLSEVYRYVLDSRHHEVATFQDELSFLDSFIFLQKIRFGDNLIINVELQKSNKDYILPLSMQILLENAIKHNVVSEENPLKIDIYRKENYLIIKNKVNLKKSMDSGLGIGLENIKMRYKYLSEKPMTINETDGYFSVKIPILKEIP